MKTQFISLHGKDGLGNGATEGGDEGGAERAGDLPWSQVKHLPPSIVGASPPSTLSSQPASLCLPQSREDKEQIDSINKYLERACTLQSS